MKKNHQKKISSRRGSRGIIDVQFNWIFIMIAGFVIFLFIISIVLTQKKNSDTQAGIAAVNQITTILKGKQQAADVYSEIKFPVTSMIFTCDPDTKYFTYKIESSDRIQLPLEIIFAPQALSSNNVQIWSQSFDTPFPVTAFTYITTRDTAILVYNESPSDSAKLVYDSLPSNMSKFYVGSAADIAKYNSFANKRIVCFADKDNSGCPAGSYNFVKIIPANPYNGLFDYGNVTFFVKGFPVTAGTVPYITKAALFGAIFSDNKEYYSCQMSRTLDQFNVKKSLVESRLKLVSADLPMGQCNDSINIILGEMAPVNSMQLTYSNVTAISSMTKDLVMRNNDLTLGSCPKIY